MPRRIDRAERRSELAAAVWRIVLRDGVSGASVRAVASEAGVATGSVRHCFPTQQELLEFAMREVSAVARLRVGADAGRTTASGGGDAAPAVVNLLTQLLPLDDRRLAEARVWTAFTGQAVSDPALAKIRAEADADVRQLCHDCLSWLVELGHVCAQRDLEVETERLRSLLDGLTARLVLDPAGEKAGSVETILRTQLTDLATPPAAG